MQEVVIYSWCDVHAREHEEKVKAEQSPLITIGGVTRSLDLCPECYMALVDPVLSRMEAYGTRDDAKAAKPSKTAAKAAQAKSADQPRLEEDLGGRVIHKVSDPVSIFDMIERENGQVECLFCPRDFNSTTSVYRHMESIHDVDLTSRMPTDGRDVSLLTCPECAAEGKVKLARKGQGLGAHRRVAHDVIGTSDYAERQQAAKAAAAA